MDKNYTPFNFTPINENDLSIRYLIEENRVKLMVGITVVDVILVVIMWFKFA